MTSRLLISLSLAVFAWQTAVAQLAPAADFFNSGAQFYISNNVPPALERVESGLKLYPEDEKLKKLEQLLKQQPQQNQQQKKSDDPKNQQPNQPKDSQQQQPDEQQKQADQKKAEEKKNEQPKQPEQPKASADKKDGGKPEDEKEEGQTMAAGQMTPEEAKRLLDTQKGDEQVLQLKPEGKPHDARKPVKDW